jgi:hypothetical protein
MTVGEHDSITISNCDVRPADRLRDAVFSSQRLEPGRPHRQPRRRSHWPQGRHCLPARRSQYDKASTGHTQACTAPPTRCGRGQQAEAIASVDCLQPQGARTASTHARTTSPSGERSAQIIQLGRGRLECSDNHQPCIGRLRARAVTLTAGNLAGQLATLSRELLACGNAAGSREVREDLKGTVTHRLGGGHDRANDGCGGPGRVAVLPGGRGASGFC